MRLFNSLSSVPRDSPARKHPRRSNLLEARSRNKSRTGGLTYSSRNDNLKRDKGWVVRKNRMGTLVPLSFDRDNAKLRFPGGRRGDSKVVSVNEFNG